MQSARVPGFLPSASAFRFVNSFPAGCPDVTIPLPGLGTVTVGDASAGVCNGMVYAVMDLFLAPRRLLPPSMTALPVCGSPLMNYIQARLIDSFALQWGPLSNAYQYVNLMSTLDHDTWLATGIHHRIVDSEWPQIKATSTRAGHRPSAS